MVYPQENPEETTEDVFLRGTLTYEYGDAQTAFTQTRGTIEEALDSFAEGCQRLRTAGILHQRGGEFARIATLEEQVRQLQRELGSAVR